MVPTAIPRRWSPAGVLLAPLRLLERSRGWRRRLLVVAYLILGAIAGLLAWRAASLNALPDVGDPFDVEAFLAASRVPEAEDAFVLYRRAAGALTPAPGGDSWQILRRAGAETWGSIVPARRAWVASNREALALWRAGTERPSGGPLPLDRIRLFQGADLVDRMRDLSVAAILEGMRREADGDREGALGWYAAVLRSGHHLRARTPLDWRRQADAAEVPVRLRLLGWAADPKADATILRGALAAIRAADGADPVSDNLKAEYLAIVHSLDDPARLHAEIGRASTLEYPYEDFRLPLHAYWFLKREPERGRRVARLVFANWLAQSDRPLARRPKHVGNAPTYPVWALYEADPSAPEAARALPPEAVFRWLDSTAMLWRVLPGFPTYYSTLDGERQGRAVAMVTLAEAIYLREHGEPSPSLQALVPGTLDAIPELYVDPAAGVVPQPRAGP